MVISLNQIQLGVVAFVENEVAVKAVGLAKFMYYGAGFLLTNQMEQIYKSVAQSPIVKQMGLMDENGNFELDTLYITAKYASQKSGMFTVGGVTLDESDIEKLYQYIKNAKQ